MHPSSNVVVFEGSSTIGGVWSKGSFKSSPPYRYCLLLTSVIDRVYDAFWTQTPVGMAEFSDQRLPPVPELDSYYGFFPAKYVASYLESYVESREFAGRKLSSRIRLDSRVTRLEKKGGTCEWRAHIFVHNKSLRDEEEARNYTATAQKVIDATGLTSSPYMPSLPGLETFSGELVHQKDIAQSHVLHDSANHNVIVIGGAKSAADMAYAAAKVGKTVSWVIRKSGSGPASFALAQGSGSYKNSNEAFYTRLTALFLASVFVRARRREWSLAGFVEWLLYKTSMGMLFFSWIWKRVTARAWKGADYSGRQGKGDAWGESEDRGFHNLQPDTEIFWQNDSSGINQRPDFFSTIADRVTVYRSDIDRVCERGIHLADGNGTFVPADVLLCGTGWDIRSSYAHLNDATAHDLGLPVSQSLQSAQEALHCAALDTRAEAHILRRFPVLAHPPTYHSTPATLTPLRLYKAMLPVSDPSILFLGKIMLGNHFRTAEVQALWAVSVFDGTLSLPDEDAMEREITETVAWCRKRYLGKGQLGNWFWFDMVPYTDCLLEEIGLESHRGRKGLRDLVRPCFAEDLFGLIEEYKAKYHKREST